MAKRLCHTKILIVEDSTDSRELICVILRRAGASVVSAKDGRKGIEKALKSNPDILLLDLEMPELSGFAVIKELRSMNYTKPIVAISAHTTPEDKDRCVDAGFDGYISKPFNNVDLVGVLRMHLPH